jgi:DmsE family decaheme c-type cytochrome
LTIAGIQSALQGEPQALKSQQTTQVSQQDAALSALQEFAQRLGTAQPQSIKDLTQTAEAESLLEFLQQRGSSSSAPEKAKMPAAAKKKYKDAPEATYVDSKVCATCHAAAVAEFEKTLMGRIGKTQKGKFDCQNCHGPGSAHVKAGGGRGVGGILSFGESDPRSVEEKNGVCLNREGQSHAVAAARTNRADGVMSCHTIMKDVSRKYQLKTKAQPETCYQCHKDIRSKMARSEHMPVKEGKMGCSDCHNPHGSYNDHLLKEATVNGVCFQCHADKRGPFLWEHAPVTENCLNCHDPHG